MRVLVTGATGFIGGNLLSRLQSTRPDLDLRAMSRNAQKLKNKLGYSKIDIVEADANDYSSLTNALMGCEVALSYSFYGRFISKRMEKICRKRQKSS